MRRATAVLHAGGDDDQPPCVRHGRPARGAPVPRWMGPSCASSSTSTVCSTVRRSPDWPPCTARTRRSAHVLAEVGLPGPIRSQQNAYGVHPALLDACFQSVAAHPDAQVAGNGGLLLPLGVRRLRAYGSCPQRPLLLYAGDQCRRGRVRGRPRRARRARDGPAGRARTATGHRGLRERKPRSGAERAAADHRVGTANAARGGPRRPGNVAC